MPGPSIEPSKSYNYKKPRTINWVSTLFIIAGVAAAYGAWKFGPVYWQRYKVDEALDSARAKAEGEGIREYPKSAPRIESDVLDALAARLAELGLNEEDHGLTLYFGDDYATLHADYRVVVQHPWGGSTELTFQRSVKVKRRKDL